MGLEADPAGMGFLPMGCLDMPGYTMSDPKQFYQHMILEVVPNKINDHTYHVKDLKPLKHAHGRCGGTRVFNPTAKDAINLYARMNVMYSTEPYARPRVTRGVEILIGGDHEDYKLAWNNMTYGTIAPYFIAVPLPKRNEVPYVWIDLTWPIRSILLPVAQNKLKNVAPHCVYVQLNFTRLEGDLPTIGWAEEPNTRDTSNWRGDHSKYGLDHDGPASMRIDIEKMYGTLLVPRDCRKIENQFDCLQLHRWDTINADGSHFPIPGINIRKSGVAFDAFERRRTGVSLQSGVLPVKTQLTEIVSGVVSFGVGCVPVVGPLLAYCSTAVIDTIDDLGKLKSTFTPSFFDGNVELSKAVIDTSINYAKLFIKKKKSFTLPTRGYVSGSIPGLISGPVDLPGSGPGIGQALQEGQEVDLFAHCTPLPTLYGDEVAACAKHPEWYTLVEVPSDVVLKGEEDDSEEPTTAGSGEANDVDVAPAPAAPA